MSQNCIMGLSYLEFGAAHCQCRESQDENIEIKQPTIWSLYYNQISLMSTLEGLYAVSKLFFLRLPPAAEGSNKNVQSSAFADLRKNVPVIFTYYCPILYWQTLHFVNNLSDWKLGCFFLFINWTFLFFIGSWAKLILLLHFVLSCMQVLCFLVKSQTCLQYLC